MGFSDIMQRQAARLAGCGLDLLCPPQCGVCGTDLVIPGRPGAFVTGPAICPACRRLLGGPDRCTRCGGGDCVGGCRGVGEWDGIVVLGSYGDDLRRAVLRAKRPAGEPLAAALGALCAERHAATIAAWRIDVVVPVPMHWWRRAMRGTTAAGEIARGLAAALGRPCLPGLVRTRCTTLQNRLPFEERPGNVRGAFRALPRVAGRRVLLVDDVVTTGGTCRACRETLCGAGAEAVYVAAVARADRGDDGPGGAAG